MLYIVQEKSGKPFCVIEAKGGITEDEFAKIHYEWLEARGGPVRNLMWEDIFDFAAYVFKKTEINIVIKSIKGQMRL